MGPSGWNLSEEKEGKGIGTKQFPTPDSTWLGCKDSNLDRQIQRLQSYHWTTPEYLKKITKLVFSVKRKGLESLKGILKGLTL